VSAARDREKNDDGFGEFEKAIGEMSQSDIVSASEQPSPAIAPVAGADPLDASTIRSHGLRLAQTEEQIAKLQRQITELQQQIQYIRHQGPVSHPEIPLRRSTITIQDAVEPPPNADTAAAEKKQTRSKSESQPGRDDQYNYGMGVKGEAWEAPAMSMSERPGMPGSVLHSEIPSRRSTITTRGASQTAAQAAAQHAQAAASASQAATLHAQAQALMSNPATAAAGAQREAQAEALDRQSQAEEAQAMALDAQAQEQAAREAIDREREAP
jgi:hypothetical protein